MAAESVPIATKLVKPIPPVLWFLLAIFSLVPFCWSIRGGLSPNLNSIKAMGLELSFAEDSIDATLKLTGASPQWRVKVPSKDKQQALRRTKKHLEVLRDAQVFWLDNRPASDINKQVMLGQPKVGTQATQSTEEALAILKSGRHSLVISDMARGDENTPGLKFLERFRKASKTPPAIFHLGEFNPGQGIPGQAFGIINRPEGLPYWTLDALARKRS